MRCADWMRPFLPGSTGVKLNAVLLGGFNDDEIPGARRTHKSISRRRSLHRVDADGAAPAGRVSAGLRRGVERAAGADGPAAGRRRGERYILPGAQGYVGLIRP